MASLLVDRILELAPSPAYVIDLGRLRDNLAVLADIQRRSGAKILLALKAFAMWSVFPLLRQTLHGVCASSPWEARLGRQEFGREVHAYSAAFGERDLMEVLHTADHVIFNSINQLDRFRPLWQPHCGRVSIGLRINPEHSEGSPDVYNPCAPASRLGIRSSQLERRSLQGVDGLLFHTLCEHPFVSLERTARVVEEKFGSFLAGMKWINFGGGHHLTGPNYDIDGLVSLIHHFRQRYNIDVYLEPGEAVVHGAGLLTMEVLDIVNNGVDIAIVDASATCHVPALQEAPYLPDMHRAFAPDIKPHIYHIGGPSCLSGDSFGAWSFEHPLSPGDRLALLDMGHYTMVRNTSFNGLRLPSIYTFEPETEVLTLIRSFGYEDYRHRLS